MTPSSMFIVFILSLLSFVSAQATNDSGFHFEADPLTSGDLAIWCIFDFLNIIIALLSLLPIWRLRAHRAPFFALCAASFYTVVQSTVNISYIVYTHGAFPQSANTVLELLSTITFFGNWSSPFLYLALVLVLFDRRKSTTRGTLTSCDMFVFNANFGYFGFLQLLATITSGLYARQANIQQSLDHSGRVTEAQISSLINAQTRYTNAFYVFTAFWAFSAFCFGGLAGYVYWRARRAEIHDKISKIMLFVVTPLYILGVVQTVVFTIFFSPAINDTVTTIEQEQLILANDILNNAIYTAIMAIVLALGFKKMYWNVSELGVSLVNLGALSPRAYVELEDPQQK